MSLEERLAKALEDNTKLQEQNFKLVELCEEQKKKIDHQKIALKAYTNELNELRKPVTLEQIEEFDYTSVDFWQNLKKLSEENKYKVLKKFVDEFETKLSQEKKRLLAEHSKPYAQVDRELKEQLLKKQDENVGFFSKKQHEKEISELKEKRKANSLEHERTKPGSVKLEDSARNNISEASGIEDLWSKVRKAKYEYVIAYEKKREEENNTW